MRLRNAAAPKSEEFFEFTTVKLWGLINPSKINKIVLKNLQLQSARDSVIQRSLPATITK